MPVRTPVHAWVIQCLANRVPGIYRSAATVMVPMSRRRRIGRPSLGAMMYSRFVVPRVSGHGDCNSHGCDQSNCELPHWDLRVRIFLQRGQLRDVPRDLGARLSAGELWETTEALGTIPAAQSYSYLLRAAHFLNSINHLPQKTLLSASMPVGPCASIPHQGSGHLVRTRLHAASAHHGHSGSAGRTPITLAKCLCWKDSSARSAGSAWTT
jgi:hypothetical protein